MNFSPAPFPGPAGPPRQPPFPLSFPPPARPTAPTLPRGPARATAHPSLTAAAQRTAHTPPPARTRRPRGPARSRGPSQPQPKSPRRAWPSSARTRPCAHDGAWRAPAAAAATAQPGARASGAPLFIFLEPPDARFLPHVA
jgi:hypothetical protein